MEKIRKRMRLYLTLILIFSVFIIASAIIGFIYISTNELLSTILIVLAVIILFFTLKLNREFEISRHNYIYLTLLKSKDSNIIKNINLLNSSHHEYLIKNLNYQTKANGDDYTIYYKVDDGINNKRRNKTLYAILVFKKDLSFEDRELSNIFEDLENSLSKGESFHNRIFFQIKIKNQVFSKEDIINTDKIFFIKHQRNSVVVLNVLYNPINRELYYLRSKNYKLAFFIDFAFKKLDEIIK